MLEKLLPALLAFLGSLLALYAQRRTMHEGWLRQNRAEVFAKFLISLQEYRNEELLHINEEDPAVLSYSLDKIQTTANIVCLYLPKESRIEFRRNFDGYMNFQPNWEKVTGTSADLRARFEPKYEFERNIQKLFEENLKAPTWSV